MQQISTIGIGAVAERAGVSVGTVSNYFNKPELLAEATAERVRTAIDDLGYVRNTSARALRVGKSDMVGLLVLDIGNPFFTEFVDGAESVATEIGYATVLGNSREQADNEARYLDLFQEQRVSGVILAPIGDIHPRLDQLREGGIPSVLIDDGADLESFCSVAVDDRIGGELAVNHLIERGCRRLLIVTGPRRIHQAHARIDGAVSRGRAAGIPLDLVHAEAFTAAAARACVSELLASGEAPFDGIFAANDVMAMGALQAVHEDGLVAPRDVAIIGYDDIAYAAALSPALTSVRQPTREMGMEAMRLLIEEMQGQPDHAHHRTLFKPTLVQRETT
ncbi:MAG: LacI family DNA-binding transcriptional regulator [Actinobacteria bacterium]|nr:LacI family DNA-binding transcriptional regulator [Actinomycetota bacterium]